MTLNLLANYVSLIWSSFIGILLIPTYIDYLGMEAYGLIGFFSLLMLWLGLLDFGMGPTINREMACYSAGSKSILGIKNLLRTVEVLTLIIGLVFNLMLWISASWIASKWMQLENITLDTASNALIMMGVISTLRFIEALYKNALMGLQKQVLSNVINVFLSTLRAVGVLLVFKYVSTSIEAFFWWQMLVAIVGLFIYMFYAYYVLANNDITGYFNWKSIREVGTFASGMFGVSLVTLALTSSDKIILSKLLTLSDFGRYTFAVTVSTMVIMIVTPIVSAVYPRMCQLIESKQTQSLIYCYHKYSQLVSALVGGIGINAAIFSEELIKAWTGNVKFATDTHELVSILIIVNTINALMYLPYHLQLAYGWTSLSFKTNLFSLFSVVPLLFYLVPNYGSLGAAYIHLGLNIVYITLVICIMHKKILEKEINRWYFVDLCPQILVTTLVSSLAYFFMFTLTSELYKLILIIASIIISVFISVYISPDINYKYGIKK